jgi:hypothetical protein
MLKGVIKVNKIIKVKVLIAYPWELKTRCQKKGNVIKGDDYAENPYL